MSCSRSHATLIGLCILGLLPATSGFAALQTIDGVWLPLESSSSAPSARREYAAIYDIQRDRYVIFGGFGFEAPHASGLFMEVWTLSLGLHPEWTRLDIAGPAPGERHSPQWGYDPVRERLIVFGGYGHHYPNGPNEYLNDVWELSLAGTPTWTELYPSGTPPSGRLAGASVYDPLRQRFVGFGGTVGVPVDTYVLDLSGEPAWTSVPTDSVPSGSTPRGGYGMTSIFDPVRDRMLVFGGSTSDEYFGVHNDVWELSLGNPLTWRQLEPLGEAPSARRTLTSIHDPIRDRMVIYAGWDSGADTTAFLDDTWALSLSPLLQWRKLDPAGDIPNGRDAMAAVHDPLSDRMVVFGGWSGSDMLGDTWFLHWGLPAQAATLTPSSEVNSETATIAWETAAVSGVRAGVYRRQSGTPWSSIATIDAAGSGTLSYQDTDVESGERYGYQLVVSSGQGPVAGGETWVDIPTPTDVDPMPKQFALLPVSPNPLVDNLSVRFGLPSAEPAQIEVLDLSGRRLLLREVGSMGPGLHTILLADARDFVAGVYFVRLTQSGRSTMRRAVITGLGR